MLEHPDGSHAWERFGVRKPKRGEGWIDAGDGLGVTCSVEQGHYGHRARKSTWLYLVGHPAPPELSWGPSTTRKKPVQGRLFGTYEEEEERMKKKGAMADLSHDERAKTPRAFRELLLDLARACSAPAALVREVG